MQERQPAMSSAPTRPSAGDTHRDGGNAQRSWFEDIEQRAQASTPSAAPLGTVNYYNIYRSFVAARAAWGLILLMLQLGARVTGYAPQRLVLMLCAAYAIESVGLWLAHRVRYPDKAGVEWTRLKGRQWAATIGTDLIAFSLLHFLTFDTALNFQALLALPVLMAGVLTRRLFALAVAAAATLLLLSGSWLASAMALSNASTLLAQAGLTGGGLFAIALLASELASRLASAQASALGSKEMAQQQADLNQLMIEELHEGVLVIDSHGWVRAANPAARRLLTHEGIAQTIPFLMRGVPQWASILDAVDQAHDQGFWPEDGRDVVIHTTGVNAPIARSLRLRIRFTQSNRAQGTESLCVLFFEDTRNVHARLRNDKLAAMGRMSAGVAHEIRNPLASIAQANALLAEDATDPTQRQLTRMVADNVERLKRIVSDVLTVAAGPAQTQSAPPIAIAEHVATVCKEWQATMRLPGELHDGDPHSPLYLSLPHSGREPMWVRMDPEHLRRVVVNLLDNALRHGSKLPGSVRVVLKRLSQHECRLSVFSDSPPIDADIERSLFEPFFSTRSQGTGLGLYISRQLCELAGASLEYRQRPAGHVHRNEFFMTLALDLPAQPAPPT